MSQRIMRNINQPAVTVTYDGMPWPAGSYTLTSVTGVPQVLCPDLLTLEHIGVADNLRGRVVRGFFQLMRIWSP